jgi:dihydroneopterin aldolase
LDIIFLHGLKIDCVIGVWEWERRITQPVFIDIDMGWDISAAAASDQLEETLSYKDVSIQVTELVQEGKYNLVETMAEKIASLLLDDFKVPWCRVRVNKKGAVSSANDVGVLIERGSQT